MVELRSGFEKQFCKLNIQLQCLWCEHLHQNKQWEGAGLAFWQSLNHEMRSFQPPIGKDAQA